MIIFRQKITLTVITISGLQCNSELYCNDKIVVAITNKKQTVLMITTKVFFNLHKTQIIGKQKSKKIENYFLIFKVLNSIGSTL